MSNEAYQTYKQVCSQELTFLISIREKIILENCSLEQAITSSIKNKTYDTNVLKPLVEKMQKALLKNKDKSIIKIIDEIGNERMFCYSFQKKVGMC